MRHAARSDPNHARLNAFARRLGIKTRTIKLPCDALWLMPSGRVLLAEFKKDAKSAYTEIQAELLAEHWPLVRIETEEDVLALVAAHGPR